MKPKPKIDPADRDPAKLDDIETVMRHLLETPADSRPKSENREPTKKELEERYKIVRRK